MPYALRKDRDDVDQRWSGEIMYVQYKIKPLKGANKECEEEKWTKSLCLIP